MLNEPTDSRYSPFVQVLPSSTGTSTEGEEQLQEVAERLKEVEEVAEWIQEVAALWRGRRKARGRSQGLEEVVELGGKGSQSLEVDTPG